MVTFKPPSADLSDLVRILRFSGQYFEFEGRWAGILNKLQVGGLCVSMFLCILTAFKPYDGNIFAESSYVRVVYLTFSAMLGYMSIYYGGVKDTMGIELTYTILGTMTMCQQLHMFRYHKDTEEVIEMIRNIRERFQKGTDEIFSAHIRTVHIAVYCYYAFFIVTSTIMTIPALVDIFILSWQNPVAFHLPMALESILDKEQTRNLKYFFVVFQANAWMFTSGLTHFGIDAFLFISCSAYSSLTSTFCQSLHLDPELDPKQRTAYIRTVAAHQQALLRLTQKVRLLVGFPYFFQNLIGAFVICSMLYVMESDESSSLVSFISNGANLMVVLGLMSLTAFVGQRFTNQSSLIFDAVYDFPWYELSPSDRSYFLSMIGAAREPFKIHFHQCMSLDAENFMAILNTSYSYLMFMKSE